MITDKFKVTEKHLDALQVMDFVNAKEALEILCQNLEIKTAEYHLIDGFWKIAKTKPDNNVSFLYSIFMDEIKAGTEHTVELIEKYMSNTDQQGDYRLKINGQNYNIKFKHAPSQKKATFKVHSLQEYVKNSIYIIFIFGGGHIEDMNMDDARWGMISPGNINRMLSDKSEKIKRDPAFDHKRCIHLDRREYKKYFKAHGFKNVKEL